MNSNELTEKELKLVRFYEKYYDAYGRIKYFNLVAIGLILVAGYFFGVRTGDQAAIYFAIVCITIFYLSMDFTSKIRSLTAIIMKLNKQIDEINQR